MARFTEEIQTLMLRKEITIMKALIEVLNTTILLKNTEINRDELKYREVEMDRIYRGNRDIAVETCMPLKEGLYRGIKHTNNIEKLILSKKNLSIEALNIIMLLNYSNINQ